LIEQLLADCDFTNGRNPVPDINFIEGILLSGLCGSLLGY
jgi:hypothetical protein